MGIYNLGGGGGGTSELQAKEATPLITNAQQIILPDEGYDGLSKVTVNPMPAGALKTPTVNSIGYVSSGVQTAGYLNTSATSGLQLSTQAAKTITPTTYSQTAVASGKYTTGAVTVGAVSLQSKTVSPSSSSQTVKPDSGYTGLSQVTVNGITLQNKTVTPSSSIQYISADSGYNGLGTVTVNRGFYRATGSFMGNGANTISIYISSDLADYYIVTASVRAYIINSSPSFYAGDTFNGLAWLDGSGQVIFNLHDPGHNSNSALIASNNNGTVTLNFLVPSSALIFGPFANGATYEYEFIFGKN